jgi:hypothetical protein
VLADAVLETYPADTLDALRENVSRSRERARAR